MTDHIIFNFRPYCKKCKGLCCKVPYVAFLTPRDIERISKKTLCLNFYLKWGSFYFMRIKNNKCIFYDEINQSCSIYDVRPLDCRSYPLLCRYNDNRKLTWRIDFNCPVANFLPSSRIIQMKKVVLTELQSLKETERHYLRSY